MLQHVSRAVRPADVEDCVRFYRLLGFREVTPPPGLAGRVRWLELPAAAPEPVTQLHLLLADNAVPEQGHFAFVAPRYAALLARLSEHGHPPEPGTPYWGAQRAFVRDPAGHRVELMEYAPQ